MQMRHDGSVPVRARRCAVYTRKSTDERLDRDFNTLESQVSSARPYASGLACIAMFRPAREEGCALLPKSRRSLMVSDIEIIRTERLLRCSAARRRRCWLRSSAAAARLPGWPNAMACPRACFTTGAGTAAPPGKPHQRVDAVGLVTRLPPVWQRLTTVKS